MLAFLFPGQGSQFVGMCKEEYETNPIARSIIDLVCEILGYDIKIPMFYGPEEALKMTLNTQLAIFLHSYVLLEKYKHLDPKGVAGHSLGEFSALVAAGCITLKEGIQIISVRAQAMHEACILNPGKMAAVFGIDEDELKRLCNKVNETLGKDSVWVANANSDSQNVVSGTIEAINALIVLITVYGKESGKKIKIRELPVSGAFHTSLMASAANKLEEIMDKITFKDPIIPIYMNFDGERHTKASEIKNNSKMQLTNPVRWYKSNENMKRDGYHYAKEIGPGNKLNGLCKNIFDMDKYALIS